MHVGYTVDKLTRLTTHFGHKIFINVVWAMEVPNKNCANSISGNADRD